MYNEIRQIPRALVIALVAAAILAVLIPTCAMTMTCGSMVMGSLADLLTCDSMWLPSDVAPGIMVNLLLFAFVALFAALFILPVEIHERIGSALLKAPIPHPPDDPLMGRLVI